MSTNENLLRYTNDHVMIVVVINMNLMPLASQDPMTFPFANAHHGSTSIRMYYSNLRRKIEGTHYQISK